MVSKTYRVEGLKPHRARRDRRLANHTNPLPWPKR
jgi:hypothetical protein